MRFTKSRYKFTTYISSSPFLTYEKISQSFETKSLFLIFLDEAIAPETTIERNLDLVADEDELETIPEINFGVRKLPKLFPNHEDDDEFDLLELCLKEMLCGHFLTVSQDKAKKII